MNHPRAILLASLVALLLAPGAAFTQPDGGGGKVVELAKGLYTIIGWADAGNPAFFVTDAGVVVIDSGDSPAHGRDIVARVKETTDRPIRYLVITHYHNDHTYGIQGFAEDVVVIGSEELAVNIRRFSAEEAKGYPATLATIRKKLDDLAKQATPEARKEEERLKGRLQVFEGLADLRILYPEITFDKRLIIHLGGKTIEVIHPGRTHTNCSSLVRIPDLKAVVMGDMLFNDSHPYIDYNAGSDTAHWMDVLREALTWEVDIVLPGHGPVGGKKEIEKQIRYLTDLRKEVDAAIKKGMTLEETKKAVTMEAYKSYDWPEGLPYDIEAVYREMKPEPASGR